jgi:AcrR family transcriptional regulator
MTQEVHPETATTRERVRSAAVELFGEKGYDGVSMNELAERVGIAKPSLYNYYRSKEEILLDLVDDGLGRWIEACEPALGTPAGSYEEFLRDHLLAVVAFARRSPAAVAVFHLASTHVQGELAGRVEEAVWRHLGPFRARCDERLRAAIEAGEMAAGDAAAAQALLSIFFQGLLYQLTVNRRDAERSLDNLPGVWRLLYRGLSGRAPERGLPDREAKETPA